MPRPRLPVGADTNAARSYYQLAEPLVRISIKLDTALMALYWASRLDPGWPDPIYARSLIPLDAITTDAYQTWFQTHSTAAMNKLALTEQQIAAIDSLQRFAWDRNPFFYSDLEFRRLLLVPGRRRDPARDGYLMFATRRFVAAESLFAIGLKKHPEDFVLRTYRARALFYLEQYDSVVVELEAARDTIRHRAVEHGVPIFLSVEMIEFAIGITRVERDDPWRGAAVSDLTGLTGVAPDSR